MIRVEKFQISRRPYAVQTESLRQNLNGTWRLDAVWFRRRDGRTAACIGNLWGSFARQAPENAADFLARWDGRYGGECEGRWDGTGYWGSEIPRTASAHLEILRPVLAAFPDAPAGYDAWWQQVTR